MRFEFATATKIIFGAGVLNEVGKLAAQMGQHALIVVGGKAERASELLTLLHEQDVHTTLLSVISEPSVEMAREGAQQARDADCDMVIGFGGGSALDTGKAIAALLTNPGDPLDYLEVIGRGQPVKYPSVPFIAIPTTAGTGSEVTSNAVLASTKHRVKVSLRSPLMLARVAIVDPSLTHGLPPDVTAQTGLDALTQVIEPFVSNKANPMTDAFCREGIGRAARSLRRAYEQGDDAAAREDMALTSLFGGLALANAKLGAVHGFAGPFGGMFDAPHGAICARLLPFVMDTNIKALRERDANGEAMQRYSEVGRLLTGRETATAEDGAQWVHELCAALNIPPLSTYGLTEADYPSLIEKSAVASSMQGNPIKLTTDEMRQILARAY
ncbi:MAG: iron-containing alcohol dehydrogenase [Anaerolineae bacterium]|nr:iron-containing alcohol dehydrogenase [Anaerolineae bacterium]